MGAPGGIFELTGMIRGIPAVIYTLPRKPAKPMLSFVERCPFGTRAVHDFSLKTRAGVTASAALPSSPPPPVFEQLGTICTGTLGYSAPSRKAITLA